MNATQQINHEVETSIAYLCLGSNLGDRAANLIRAISALVSNRLQLIAASSIYETEPVDDLDQPSFLNQVIALRGRKLEPFPLLKFCLETETRLGRRRRRPGGPRTIDIDLLLLDDLVIDETRFGIELILPHPRIHLRRFVLTPLAEIAPDLKHPVLEKTASELLAAVADSSAVKTYSD